MTSFDQWPCLFSKIYIDIEADRESNDGRTIRIIYSKQQRRISYLLAVGLLLPKTYSLRYIAARSEKQNNTSLFLADRARMKASITFEKSKVRPVGWHGWFVFNDDYLLSTRISDVLNKMWSPSTGIKWFTYHMLQPGSFTSHTRHRFGYFATIWRHPNLLRFIRAYQIDLYSLSVWYLHFTTEDFLVFYSLANVT